MDVTDVVYHHPSNSMSGIVIPDLREGNNNKTYGCLGVWMKNSIYQSHCMDGCMDDTISLPYCMDGWMDVVMNKLMDVMDVDFHHPSNAHILFIVS